MGIVFLMNEDRYHLSSLVGLSYMYQADMATEWYFTVGVTVIVVQLQMLVSTAYNMYYYCRKEREKQLYNRDQFIALSQYELNKIYLGPEFELSSRYANVLSILFVCYMYSTGMPLLLIIAALFFGLTYFIDKFLFINLYRTPPKYTTDINKLSTTLIKYALLVHVVMALWTMCDSDIFKSNSVGYSKYTGEVFQFSPNSFQGLVTQQHTIPLLIVFLVIFAGLIFQFVFDEVLLNGISQILERVFNLKLRGNKEELSLYDRRTANTVLTYSQATKYGRFKSLASYNILQNPKYQASFGITSSWAMKHKHVGSLRFFHDENDNAEDDIEMQTPVYTLLGSVQEKNSHGHGSAEGGTVPTSPGSTSPMPRADSLSIMQQLMMKEIYNNEIQQKKKKSN